MGNITCTHNGTKYLARNEASSHVISCAVMYVALRINASLHTITQTREIVSNHVKVSMENALPEWPRMKSVLQWRKIEKPPDIPWLWCAPWSNNGVRSRHQSMITSWDVTSVRVRIGWQLISSDRKMVRPSTASIQRRGNRKHSFFLGSRRI